MPKMTIAQRIKLARVRRERTQQEIADHFGISSQAVSQWESGKTSAAARLSEIADLLKISRDWLFEEKGEMIPAEMDEEDGARITARKIPLINTVRAGNWQEIIDAYESGANDDYIYVTQKVGANAFGLKIDGDSMEPEFNEGDQIIVDPEVEPQPGSFVVAKRNDAKEATFKKYRLRGHDKHGYPQVDLVPLNPDHPTILLDMTHRGSIVGVMVEHRRFPRHTS